MNPDQIYARGDAAFRAGDLEEAAAAFADLIEALPEGPGRKQARAHYSLGLTMAKLGYDAEARDSYERALRADPQMTQAREALAALSPRIPEKRWTDGILGIAGRVTIQLEPDPLFGQQKNPTMRFRMTLLEPGGGPQSPTITLRGGRIVGEVRPGDVVEVPGPLTPGEPVRAVFDHTSGELIEVRRSGARIAALLTVIVMVTAFALFVWWGISTVSTWPTR